ncbi:MAG TPA: hypothetical protein VKF63_07375, partial [Terracidiphilus sp.]|nr:hypothetical protein [Terracidiphilus sp.]
MDPFFAAADNFTLFAAVTQVKGVVPAVNQKLWVSGLQRRGRGCRKDTRTTVNPHALYVGQSPMPLRQVHSRCRSHLLILDGPSEIDLQFPVQFLNSLVLLACVARDGIGGAEAVQNRAANP